VPRTFEDFSDVDHDIFSLSINAPGGVPAAGEGIENNFEWEY
jgi:hypothetical protein